MKILMRGFIHHVVIGSLAETFNEHTFYLTNCIYHPKRPSDYFPPIPKNVKLIPKISNLKELDKYDVFIGIISKDLRPTFNWKIPTVWRTFVPISMYYKYLRNCPVVYNAHESKRITVEASKIRNTYGPHIDGPVTYDYRNPQVFNNWNGHIEKGIIVANLEKGPGFGKDLYNEIVKEVPIRLVNNIPYKKLLQTYRVYRIYFEVTKTSRIISASITEAMTTGMPVVTNGTGEFKLLIENGIDGFKTSVEHDPTEMIKYAQMLIKDRNLAEEIGRNARLKAMDLFSKKRVREAFEKAFEYAFTGKW